MLDCLIKLLEPTWLSAIGSIATAIGVYFVYLQANAMKKQISADHERTRRITAIEMLKFFDTRLSRKSSICRKIAENLDFNQAKAIYTQDSFKLSESLASDFKVAFPEANLEYVNDKTEFLVQKEFSSQLRWELVSYLNLLETILVAWHHNIADQQMLEEQFKYLISHQNGHSIIKEFRQASGGKDNYPAINAFVKKFSENNNESGKSKIA